MHRWSNSLRLGVSLLALAVVAAAIIGWRHRGVVRVVMERVAELAEREYDLDHLPVNRWVKISQPLTAEWRRQGHAGIALDTKRDQLLIFGSDTHGSDWDDSIHRFDLRRRQWITDYPPSSPESYRVNQQGIAIAGPQGAYPWAMHTFDTIVYDPSLDALLVMATPLHNPKRKQVKGLARYQPTWIYDLKSHTWHTLANGGMPTPSFFAGAAAYDSHRDVIVAYKFGVWELGPDRMQWEKVNSERHHGLHSNMVYDSKRHKLAVFGGTKEKDNAIWFYTPGQRAGEKGHWEKKIPGGDPCPADEHYPVAFDQSAGVFLLLPHEKGRKKSTTFIYDPDDNRCTRVPGADMALRRMHYMMVWDPVHHAFLLVTGYWKYPATVWALKLDLAALRKESDK